MHDTEHYKSTSLLVIGDSHVEPEQDLSRFNALGHLCLEHKPDIILSIGDFLSLDSLSAWDADKKKTMEGKRYWDDVSSGNSALDALELPITCYNSVQAQKKRAQYKPRKIFLKGNHEDRLDRYIEKNPILDGAEISIEYNMNLHKRGWQVVQYKEHLVIDDVAFTHIPISNNGKPIGGKYVCQRALDLYNYSIVFGHTHRLEVANKHRHGGEHLQQSLNCGCFFDHVPDYMQGATTDYWRGVVLIDITQPMRFDIKTISMSHLMQEYRNHETQ